MADPAEVFKRFLGGGFCPKPVLATAALALHLNAHGMTETVSAAEQPPGQAQRAARRLRQCDRGWTVNG
jgi:hypothetical protein